MHLSLKGHKHGIKQMDEPVTFKNINTLITVTTTTARATCGIKAIPGVYDGGKDRISHWKQEILFSSLNIFYCVTAGWTLLTMLVIIINWWLLLELRNTQQTPESPKKKNLKKEPRNHWTQPDFRYGRSDPCLTPELLHWRQWDFISVKAVSEDGDQNYPDSPYFYSVSGSQWPKLRNIWVLSWAICSLGKQMARCILWAAYQLLTAIHTNNTARDTEQGKGQKTVLTGQQTTCPRSLLKLLFHRTSLDFSKTE